MGGCVCVWVCVWVCVGGCVYDTGIRIKSSFETIGFFFVNWTFFSELIVPYSAKFSRHLYFVDWPLKAILLHNVRGMTAYRKPRL